VDGYFETSSDLGGDIWGLDILDDRRFSLWLADFSGHGVSSAMNTFRLHTLLQHAEQRDRPADFLAAINARLAGLLPVGQYATMLYGVVDMVDGSFTYSAAASPHPVAVETATLHTQVGDGSGLPLGVSKAARYVERRLDMKPGSALFMASDALAESPAEAGAFLGQAGVVDLVRRGVAAHRAAIDVDSMLAPFLATVKRPLRDDLTAVCCVVP
jgi:serine phosphatase RsbU (regulator of sigma subunit)